MNILIKIKNWFINWKYKQEFITIPLLLFIFYLCNYFFQIFFPTGAYFDFTSQIETIINNIVMFIIAITAANFSIRIIFPNIYKWLREDFYEFNGTMDKKMKNNYAVAILITFIIAAALIF